MRNLLERAEVSERFAWVASLVRPRSLKEFMETRRISQLIVQQEIARNNYDKAKKTETDALSLEILKQAVEELSQAVLAARRLIHVSPDKNARSLHEQLINNEKVHLFKNPEDPVTDGHIENLITYRLGDDTMNKDCQALIVQTKEGPKILGGIFRFHTTISEKNGMIDVQDLPGNVDMIKNNPVEKLTGKENITGYWTISSGLNGSGPVLISDLKSTLLETTISPIRGFTNKNKRDQIMKMDDEDIRDRVLNYLLEEKDMVRNFHMGNGAFLAWIHVNRDCLPNSQDWITVNYFYDRANLNHNRKMFGNGFLPMSPVLYRMLNIEQIPKAYNVCANSLIPKKSPT